MELTHNVHSKLKEYAVTGKSVTVQWQKPSSPKPTDYHTYGSTEVEILTGASRPYALSLGLRQTLFLDGSEVVHIEMYPDENRDPIIYIDYTEAKLTQRKPEYSKT
jgi:hypothetical protein